MTTTTVAPSKTTRIVWAAIGAVIAGISIYLFWWLAIPRHQVCVAIAPAPPGCSTTNRLGIATIWTAIVVAIYLALLATLAMRVRVWVRLLLTALLLVAGVWGYSSTLHTTPLGFGS